MVLLETRDGCSSTCIITIAGIYLTIDHYANSSDKFVRNFQVSSDIGMNVECVPPA